MKIAQICQAYPPMISGASIIVQQLAKALAFEGHEIMVLAASDRGHPYQERTGSLQVIRLRSWSNPIRIDQRFSFSSGPAVMKYLHHFQPDIVHLHEPLSIGLTGLRFANRLKIPIVLTLHQLPWFVAAYVEDIPGLENLTEKALWEYGRWFLSKCTVTIVPSYAIADVVQAHAIPRPQVIHLGINSNKFSPRPAYPGEARKLFHKYGLSPDLPVILHVGRVDTEKQVDRVIKVTGQVMKHHPAQLLIVGDGRQLDQIIQISHELGITDRCHFPGFVDSDGDLPGLYRLASVFITASEIETFGIVVLEAMASGLPVIAPHATCMHELIIDGKTGFLTEPGDEESMAHRLSLCLRYPDVAHDMGKQAVARSKKFTRTKMVSEHIKFYQSLHEASGTIEPLISQEANFFSGGES